MDDSLKKEMLAASSGWVSALLNFVPGLGVGYIYQRRWKAYWATTLISTAWIVFGFYNQLSIDPADPLQANDDLKGFIGLLSIAFITALEAWYAVRQAKKAS